jgi:hypothetical protein
VGQCALIVNIGLRKAIYVEMNIGLNGVTVEQKYLKKQMNIAVTGGTLNKLNTMAKAAPKPRPMKSRKNGLKHAKRIKQNLEVLKKLTND